MIRKVPISLTGCGCGESPLGIVLQPDASEGFDEQIASEEQFVCFGDEAGNNHMSD